MLYFPQEARVKPVQVPENEVHFPGFPLGERTSVPVEQLSIGELAECINFKIYPDGNLESRQAITRVTSAPVGKVHDMKACTINGVERTIVTDQDKVYYLDSGVNNEIGTIGNAGNIIAYNDVAIICDGSYLKYCDSLTEVKMAYDAGDEGTVYNNYAGDNDGNTTGPTQGVRFVTPVWDTGYTMPPTQVHALVQDDGSPPASITFNILRASDSQVVVSKVYTGDVPNGAPGYIDISFTPADITNELAPDTEYYCTLTGTNFLLYYSDVTSGGHSWDGSAMDFTKDPIMKVHPGLPPKAEFAAIAKKRLVVKDPDHPGRVYFSNLTHLDWSTANGGGWIGVVDDSRNTFEIGGLGNLYGEGYVFGTKEQPYLCKLEGDQPDDFALPMLFQKIWTTQRTLVNVNNDLWSSSNEGVSSLAGVREYGDVRTRSISNSIEERFNFWDENTAFSGYNAQDGQYWLYLPEWGEYINVCRVRNPVTDSKGKAVYPWSRYKVPFVPSSFSQVGADFYIGSDDGYIYKLDNTEYFDFGTQEIEPTFTTGYVEMPFGTVDLIKAHIITTAQVGAEMYIDFFKNGDYNTPVYSHPLLVNYSAFYITPLNSIITNTLNDVWNEILATGKERTYFDININVFSFQIRVSDVKIIAQTLFIKDIVIKFRQLEA